MIQKNSFKLILSFLFLLLFFSCRENTKTIIEAKDSLMLMNLLNSYEYEVNSTNKFILFASEAKKEEIKTIDLLFRAISQSDRIITVSFSDIIKSYNIYPDAKVYPIKINQSAENLDSALVFKLNQLEKFSEYLNNSEQNKNDKAIQIYKKAIKNIQIQIELLKEAKEELKEGSSKTREFFICSECGLIVKAIGFEICPICQNSKENFFKLNIY